MKLDILSHDDSYCPVLSIDDAMEKMEVTGVSELFEIDNPQEIKNNAEVDKPITMKVDTDTSVDELERDDVSAGDDLDIANDGIDGKLNVLRFNAGKKTLDVSESEIDREVLAKLMGDIEREEQTAKVDGEDEITFEVKNIADSYNCADVAEPIDAKDDVLEDRVTIADSNTGQEKLIDTNTTSENKESMVLIDSIRRTNESRRRKMGLWKSRVGGIFTAIVALLAVVLVGLRLAGFRTFTVMSGSMDPKYPVGAMIYVQPIDYKLLKEGDVISFVANDDNTIVTHRIAEVLVDEKDSDVWRFRTKGDANATVDANAVHYKNVLGTPVITIPFIGYFAHNIQQPPGIYIALVVGTLLLAWTFLPGTLEERRKTARKSMA